MYVGAYMQGIDMLPHQKFWQEAHGLVIDGVRFTTARANDIMGRSSSSTSGTEQRGGEYGAVGAVAEDSNTSSPVTKTPIDLDSPIKDVDDSKPLLGDDVAGASDNDDDELVE